MRSRVKWSNPWCWAALLAVAQGCGLSQRNDDGASSPTGSAAGGNEAQGGNDARGGSDSRAGTSAGQAGRGPDVRRPLGDKCEGFPDPDAATVRTSCTFEDTCRVLDCGGPWSDFDANGCRREYCHSQDDCGVGERCEGGAAFGEDCHPSVYEWCDLEPDGSCFCSPSADCNEASFCFPFVHP